MKKIYNLFILPFLAVSLLSGCEKFLGETPDKSGSSMIYHMDQLKEMTSNPELFMYNSYAISAANQGWCASYMQELSYLSDAVSYEPEYFVKAMKSSESKNYDFYSLKPSFFTQQSTMAFTWTAAYNRIYTFNTMLTYLDQVEQTTPEDYNRVKGEALFGRAYYQFMLLCQYCLWDDNAPGIGYRDNPNPGDIPERMTVKYTVDRIYADLDAAEEALVNAGRDSYELRDRFHPTAVTVKAFRARVALYRGDYAVALKNATDALGKYNVLTNLYDDPNQQPVAANGVKYLNAEGTAVEQTLGYNRCFPISRSNHVPMTEDKEVFLSNYTTALWMPLSKWYFDLFDKENDARWTCWYYNHFIMNSYSKGVVQTLMVDGVSTSKCVTKEDQKWIKDYEYMWHCYLRYYGRGTAFNLGMTTPEMYLIKAECEARAGKNAEAATTLKTLRRARFKDQTVADNVGSSVSLETVLDERAREMSYIWRVYDIKRRNGSDKANISLKRRILTIPSDLSTEVELILGPDDPRWALPFNTLEVKIMGWEQNPGWDEPNAQ